MPISTETTLVFGNPKVVFESVSTFGLLGRTFDISPHGTRFLIIDKAASDEAERPRLLVVQNWTEESQRVVPVD